jgi:integrase
VRGRIWQRGEKWQVIIVTGKRANGDEKRNYYTCATEDEARRLLHEKMHSLYQGTYTEPHQLTLEAYSRQWLADYAALHVRPATLDYYERQLRLHIWPHIGSVLMTDLRAHDAQRVLAAAKRAGLSPKTVKHIHTTLRRVLSQAVRWELVPRNAAKQVDPPPVPRREVEYWTAAQAQAFLDAVAEHWLHPFFHLALATGMRRGELIGLQWRDVDLEAGTVAVRRAQTMEGGKAVLAEVKTPAGVRVISIGERAVEVLRQRRGIGNALVFPSEIGTLLPATTPRRVMARYVERAGLPHIPLHGLRHTHATLLLAAGIHPKVVSERLGHASVQITLDTYSHLLPNLQREAATAIDAALR